MTPVTVRVASLLAVTLTTRADSLLTRNGLRWLSPRSAALLCTPVLTCADAAGLPRLSPPLPRRSGLQNRWTAHRVVGGFDSRPPPPPAHMPWPGKSRCASSRDCTRVLEGLPRRGRPPGAGQQAEPLQASRLGAIVVFLRYFRQCDRGSGRAALGRDDAYIWSGPWANSDPVLQRRVHVAPRMRHRHEDIGILCLLYHFLVRIRFRSSAPTRR